MAGIRAAGSGAHWPFRSLKFYVVSAAILTTFPIGWHSPRATTPPGFPRPVSMSLQDTLLFISDKSTGIHVYNIKNPGTPQFALNIPLHGNRSTAARGDIVYANDWESLLAIRVQGDSYEVVKTIKRAPPHFIDMVVMDDRDNRWGCDCAQRDVLMSPAPAGSVGSSYATFAVIDSFLYYLDQFSIVTLDISTPEDPIELTRTHIDWGAETLYPTDKCLFVGGTRGMYIFDRSNPESPVQIARFEHFEACDPVVVSDTLAFVTLRGGNACGETRDVLLSISIKNPERPVLVGEKPIETPYGLAVNNPHLYVSSGDNGYQLLDFTAPDKPFVVKAWPDWATKDFIWFEDVLMVLGYGDVRIYDVTAPENPILLSKLE
jgi:hypothetical protein